MFAVFDGNKPAKYPEHEVDPSWSNNVFDTFEEARKYAWMWLAPYGGEYDGSSGVDLKLNTPYDYSCCEIPCYIEIRGTP